MSKSLVPSLETVQQAVIAAHVAAEPDGQRFGDPARLLGRLHAEVGGKRRAALGHRSVEQTGGPRRHQLMHDGEGAGALAEQRDVIGIAAEGGDIALDPPEGQALVLEGHVAGRLGRLQAEEAEGAEAIVERDDEDVAVVGQVLGAVEELAAGAADVRAAVDPHHHWQRRPERVARILWTA